jgi:hypothetical protein
LDDVLTFGSRNYFLVLGLLLFARGTDFLSTWIATPNLVLEGNPLAKKLGWKWGAVINLTLCVTFACWPLPAIVICTSSVLVAARNFQSAWLMRSLGEESYRNWHVERFQETRISLFLFCLFGQTGLLIAIGTILVLFTSGELVSLGVGLGIIAYALAVAIYTLLSIWRIRRGSN